MDQRQFAQAKLSVLRSTPQKVNLVLQLIRGKHVSDALDFLSNSQKRVAGEIRKLLLSAIANAENNHGMDIENLYVNEAIVGKAFVMKRMQPRARGRGGRILKAFSSVRVTLVEGEV